MLSSITVYEQVYASMVKTHAHTHIPTVCVPRYGRYDPSLRRPQLHELNDFEKTLRDSNVAHGIMRKLCHHGDGLKGYRRSQCTSKCVSSMVKTLTKIPVCCVQKWYGDVTPSTSDMNISSVSSSHGDRRPVPKPP